MTSRRVEQVRIPVFECFSLTVKGVVVTARHQIYLHMLNVANSWFEVSVSFSVLASVNSSANVHPPQYVGIHFMPAGNTAAKHGKMDEIPRVFTHKPRAFKIPGGSEAQIWRYPGAYFSAVLARNWMLDAQTRQVGFWTGQCQ